MQTGLHGMIVLEKHVRPTNELDAEGLPLETFIDDDHNDDDDGISKKTCNKTKKKKELEPE